MIQNGYIEIEINGRKTGLKFNMYAIERMGEIRGKESALKNFAAIIWAGILGNAYIKQTEPEFTFEEVADFAELQLLNNDEGGVLERVSEAFLNSRSYQALINRANGEPSEDAKKKMIATP